ncbi:hypothetical protein DSO57_1005228 [Entomophthora muscae]|uniref:Uncharacterized protein n=1 Tax=Entomophthora muscae TaxID=34485 RepID=A0ACC2U6B5_9FUNG|nr:hypothetical protein DSO57_1005228 [Entomophthora muscae]
MSQEDTHVPLPNHFRGKTVCKLYCNTCSTLVCNRGMKAMLLADTKVELFSTDSPPRLVQLVYNDYLTPNCLCRIRNVACLVCGNIVGYHITQPCAKCMDSCNNGHFWMFHTEGVFSEERQDPSGKSYECLFLNKVGSQTLIWACLAPAEKDFECVSAEAETICR